MSVTNLHLGIFGRTNTGKSSLINMLTDQDISIVSEKKGTTTDPVKKTVEIFGIGPATIIDTAGVDDLGEIGHLKIQKSLEVIRRVDCAILLIAGNQFGDYEVRLIDQFKEHDVPYIIVHNKNDISKIAAITKNAIKWHTNAEIIDISTLNSTDRDLLINSLKKIIPETVYKNLTLIGDLVKPKDLILIIIAIDSEAPEGRLIYPQNLTIRDAIDNHCITVVLREDEIEDFLKSGLTPALVITDSQIFKSVTEKLPENIPLTSFSILFARLKGNLIAYLRGTPCISNLKDGDNVLILESCTHQTSCDDIGRVKIPKKLKEFTGKRLNFKIISGLSPLPENIDDFALVIQCGGCMVTSKQLSNRINPFIKRGIPVTNYGMALAYVNGVFERVVSIFRKFSEYDRNNPKLPFIEG